jgi:hypothetical protein
MEPMSRARQVGGDQHRAPSDAVDPHADEQPEQDRRRGLRGREQAHLGGVGTQGEGGGER